MARAEESLALLGRHRPRLPGTEPRRVPGTAPVPARARGLALGPAPLRQPGAVPGAGGRRHRPARSPGRYRRLCRPGQDEGHSGSSSPLLSDVGISQGSGCLSLGFFSVFCNLLDEGVKKAMHCLKCIRLNFHYRIVEAKSQVWKKGGDFEKSILLLLSNLPPISQADMASVCFVLLSKTTPLPAEPGTGVVCIATF